MDSESTLLAVLAFGSCAFILLVRHLSNSHKAKRLPLPPGPKTSWFGGIRLPKAYPWLTYAQWKDTFGDIIYIYTFGNPIIVLNSAEAADMLLDKRGNKYSSRPERTMVYELMGWDWALTMMPYGPRWRRHRAKFQKHFHASLSPLYQPTQMEEAHTLLRNLLTNPDNFNHYIRRAAAAIILNITYGYSVADEHDAYVVLANTTMRSFAQAIVFGSYLVDYIPMLKYVPSWMPGASFKRKALEWRRLSREMLESQFKLVKQKMAHGTAVSCITTRELDNWMEAGGDADAEELIMNIAAIAYAGGADTTVSSITSFFLAMVLSPGIQKKAQDEIDCLTAGNRIPTFADKLSLPYISRIVWECLRWNPASPLGGTHFTTEDDEYNGYRIPKGTTVIPNVWAILHDEHTYPEPFTFNPDRFENQEMNRLAGINELPQAAFGFGRRMCPGRWLSYDSIWITVVSVLSVYNISTAIDNNGLPILPSVEYTSSSFSHPKPFKCRIVPRSEAAAALIKQTAEERA